MHCFRIPKLLIKLLVGYLTIGLATAGYADPREQHIVLGSDIYLDTSSIEVLMDAQFDGLRIRHVRYNSTSCIFGTTDVLELQGTIGPDSSRVVEMLLPRMQGCVTEQSGTTSAKQVYLDSRGGYLEDGYKIGELFRQYGVQAIVSGSQECSSACAVAFLGAIFRRIDFDGQLLFHAPYRPVGPFFEVAFQSPDCSDSGQVDGLRNYFEKMLGPEDGLYAFERTMSYCSTDSGWTLNGDAARLFHIATD